MGIILKNTWEELETYIEKSSEDGNYEKNWADYVVTPFWSDLCCYAPMDLSERKPAAIKDLISLRKQLRLLKAIDMADLKNEMERITGILPNFDDDPITIVLFPLNDENTTVKVKQNGVIGTALFGNMIIQINPLASDFISWIPYVFAHEYYHTVWGNYWYVLHGGELDCKFVNSLFSDGEADSFALSLYPNLKPAWIFDSISDAETMWDNTYKNLWDKDDVDYVRYMFGDMENGIPWCAGYTIGYMLVQKYLRYAGKNVIDILKEKPEKILKEVL